ncbi:MAG: tryptophanase [Candidatus Niyogibacteria bacterium]|nr:tryptophanase [Candidatus Niyogibacteria bacterium]
MGKTTAKKYIIPRYKTRIVGVSNTPISLISKKARMRELQRAHYNPFKISSSDKIFIDLLTASGTGALSKKQYHMSMRESDESYAGSLSWNRLRESIREFSGKQDIFPVHQGRAAERILSEIFLAPEDVTVSNGHFDTTEANFSKRGARPIDIPALKTSTAYHAQFRGNIDIDELRKRLDSPMSNKIKIILLTLTNNTIGAQPVSLHNVREAAKYAKKFNKLFMIDACRIAQNAYFIWRDEIQKQKSIPEIIRECFRVADIAYMSLKKDGLSHMGGFIVTNSAALTHAVAEKIKNVKKEIISGEGYVTYGGMSGSDMEKGAQGLKEVVRFTYLQERMNQTAYLQEQLVQAGVPIRDDAPPGGDAVFVDAGKLLAHIPPSQFPGKTLEVALYEEGGVRGCEIGSVMLGSRAEVETLRLAIPCRVYAKEHFDYVADVFGRIVKKKNTLSGFKITFDPGELRHFDGHFAPIE